MIEEPYNFTQEDVKKYSNIDESTLSNSDKLRMGIPEGLKPGINLKDYTILHLLGEGSYSSVWKAYKKDQNNTYAIKISKPDKNDETISKNEIKCLKKLSNSNFILNLKSSFYYKDKNNKYLCMAVDSMGCDLHILKRLFKYKTNFYNSESSESSVSGSESSNSMNTPIISVPFKLSKKITYQILQGLEHIHKNNIIHTDIKLGNILIYKNMEDIKYDSDINIKICDFGTSHSTNEPSNFNIGTIDYSAPECIVGLPYGKAIDIWATGCILFELLTGICLFDYTRYYDDASEVSSGYSSSDYDNENDKTQIEFLLLCMMKKILDGFPSKVFKKAKYYNNYFDYKGRLRFSPQFLEEDTLLNSLVNEFNYDISYAQPLNDILLKFLVINPNHRSNASSLLQNSWFDDRSN